MLLCEIGWHEFDAPRFIPTECNGHIGQLWQVKGVAEFDFLTRDTILLPKNDVSLIIFLAITRIDRSLVS